MVDHGTKMSSQSDAEKDSVRLLVWTNSSIFSGLLNWNTGVDEWGRAQYTETVLLLYACLLDVAIRRLGSMLPSWQMPDQGWRDGDQVCLGWPGLLHSLGGPWWFSV